MGHGTPFHSLLSVYSKDHYDVFIKLYLINYKFNTDILTNPPSIEVPMVPQITVHFSGIHT